MNIQPRIGRLVLVAFATLAACGGNASTAGPAGSPAGQAQVLPVSSNPIVNSATVPSLAIESVLVENNVDPKTGKDVADHLEIALSNSGATELRGFEIFYTFKDLTAGQSESYFAKLPDDFTIVAGAKRVVHFDGTGKADHFPVNKFSLYASSTNALDVTVVVSAADAAVQTATVAKDAGGDENPDE